jgi:fatty acid desaturase
MINHSGTALRLRIKYGPLISSYRRGGNLEGVGIVFGHVGLGVMAAVVSEAAIDTSLAGWLVWLASTVVIGTRMRALGNIVHECSHLGFVRSPALNRIIGEVLAVLDLSSFRAYRRVHLSHHRDLGDSERDLDLVARRDLHLERHVSNLLSESLRIAVSPSGLRSVFAPTLITAMDRWFVNTTRVGWFVFAVYASVAWPVFLLYVVMPYLTSYQILKAWSDTIDHLGLVHSDEEFGRARNHILPGRVLNWVFLPRSDAYHLVHHLFPKLPVRHAETAHRQLLLDDEYARREHSLGSHRSKATYDGLRVDLDPCASKGTVTISCKPGSSAAGTQEG